MHLSPLLEETLRIVARRYRLPDVAVYNDKASEASVATTLAITIEQGRCAAVRSEVLERTFMEALARLIEEALRKDSGDPVFQAMLLRRRATQVREYASLSAQADQDRRFIHASVNGIAHPGKQRTLSGGQREGLAQLHTLASSPYMSQLDDTVRHLLAMPEFANEPSSQRGLSRLLESPALERLRRLEALTSDELVRRYRSLWERNGPPSGSADAAAQGYASQQRGAIAEARAAHALEVLAQRLNEEERAVSAYRVVTSMRVPASIPASPDRAKSEWDAVLLREAKTVDATPASDVCLLVESKASVDAATTDLPRLLRGVRLLAHAEESVVYAFETAQGTVHLRGASLRALTTDEAALQRTVLYCCDARAEAAPRLLSAASRMQLLSAQASLEYASRVTDQQHADAQELAPVWHELLGSPQWHAVLNQYPKLRQVRDLMVHTEDLLAAIETAAEEDRPGLNGSA